MQTPRRLVRKYSLLVFFGLARRYGRSTFAPAVMHVLLLVAALFGG